MSWHDVQYKPGSDKFDKVSIPLFSISSKIHHYIFRMFAFLEDNASNAAFEIYNPKLFK